MQVECFEILPFGLNELNHEYVLPFLNFSLRQNTPTTIKKLRISPQVSADFLMYLTIKGGYDKDFFS